ncbi:hypothetical protein NUW58_g7466 [Xylaria curta]|uniref:Uncharacterized protein n=1 Tax=Xylaria curta TaxID=42375 RepID=A0ACC1NIS9_9PEZI|nr:hypothetical protein NUW58_g7466 [Xylaria curta]
MSSSAMGQDGVVQKHRACDECRIRKLACTKEPDGCSRCRRENIPCHYSAQKPMGRPRKRPREGLDESSPVVAPPTKLAMTEQPPNTEDPGMRFINLLLGSDVDFDFDFDSSAQAHAPTITAAPLPPTMETPALIRDPPWDYHNFGDVNFDSSPTDHVSSTSTAIIDPALFTTPAGSGSPATDQVPGLSPSNSNTTSSPQSANASPTAATSCVSDCDCTANLYAALSQMQKMPAEVELAIRQARLAAKVAYDVVNCPICSFRIEDSIQHGVGSPAMMRGFQNMMLLATLIPSIVHAYARMLTVVDEETNRAVAERRQVVFKLNGLGGIWGGLGDNDDNVCGVKNSYNYKELEPAMWRLTVRALLKIDVYGLSGRCGRGVAAAADPFHLGLKDIVLLMENKSKAKHAVMDAMVDAGIWQQPECAFLNNTKPGEPPTCQRIISIAKSSIEQLQIP